MPVNLGGPGSVVSIDTPMQEVYWPIQSRQQSFAALSGSGQMRGDQLANVTFGAFVGTTQSRKHPFNAGGLYCAQLGNVAAGLSAFTWDTRAGGMTLILRQGEVPTAGLISSIHLRVTRFVWWAAVVGTGEATMSDFTGMMFAPAAAGATGQPFGGNPGFGFTGDGAGNWVYRSYSALAFPGNIVETVAIPGIIKGSWNMFEAEFINSAPGRDATVDFLVNGNLVVRRTWVTGSTGELPDYLTVGGGLAASIHGVSCFQSANALEDQNIGLLIGNCLVRRSNATRDGVAIEV